MALNIIIGVVICTAVTKEAVRKKKAKMHHVKRIERAATIIQAHIRGIQARKLVHIMMRQQRAATIIQTHIRYIQARKLVHTMLERDIPLKSRLAAQSHKQDHISVTRRSLDIAVRIVTLGARGSFDKKRNKKISNGKQSEWESFSPVSTPDIPSEYSDQKSHEFPREWTVVHGSPRELSSDCSVESWIEPQAGIATVCAH